MHHTKEELPLPFFAGGTPELPSNLGHFPLLVHLAQSSSPTVANALSKMASIVACVSVLGLDALFGKQVLMSSQMKGVKTDQYSSNLEMIVSLAIIICPALVRPISLT